ncbi:MAG: 16S rRNA (guanine(527)-N(7))-methyltransferase RsmG [Sphingobium sp.]
MTEEEARAWLRNAFDVSRETWDRLEAYVAILLDEMTRQNLIAESTRDQVWARHIVDSAQLLRLAPEPQPGRDIWADLGAGAGLPGMVVAILSGWRVVMIEMRRKRIDFLTAVIDRLKLTNASVFAGKVENASLEGRTKAAVISARAYAPMERLVASAIHLTDFSTIWLLPKGQNHKNELDIARRLWHSDVKVEQSLTAPESAILVLNNVRARRG